MVIVTIGTTPYFFVLVIFRRKVGWFTFITNLVIYLVFLLSMTTIVLRTKAICASENNSTEKISLKVESAQIKCI
jgi:hypothetical protein